MTNVASASHLRDLGDKQFLMLRNYSLRTVGCSVAEAFVAMYFPTVPACCRMPERGGKPKSIASMVPSGGKGPKTRAQMLGEPVTINGRQVRDFGYQLRQLDAMLRANGLVTTLVIVDDARSAQAVRADLAARLEREGDYVLVNYNREAVGQKGGGHISPLGAYDAASDSFLVLDFNPAVAGWVWMPAATLVKGMRTFDTVENRGYVLVHAP
jgi:hypothetical protein